MKLMYVFFAAVILTGTQACSKDDDQAVPAVTIDDFVGSWIAVSVAMTENADPARTFDIVANGGELRFTMLTGGGTRTWVEFGPHSDEWDSLAKLNGNQVTMTPEETTRPVKTFTYRFVGELLELTNTNDAFDFTLTGADGVPATSVSTFMRH